MSKSALESHEQRYGKRYYPVDEGYDKRVYQNDCKNVTRIIATLIFFWIFQACHWWCIFELGINATWDLTVYSIIIFIVAVVFIGGMLLSGKYANKKKRLHEFFQEKIAERN